MEKLIQINKDKRCPNCKAYSLKDNTYFGGSDIVIARSRSGISYECINCGGIFKWQKS